MLRRLLALLVGVVSLTIALMGFGGLPGVAFAEGETCPNEAIREEQKATYLPDCRAYEMVSPANKNGGDVMADSARTRSSISGDAVDFASLTPFGDAEGSGLAAEYIAERTGQAGTSGWATHSIIPSVEPSSFFAISHGEQETHYQTFSEDLSSGILQSHTALSDEPNVANVTNIYLRDDVLSSGSGSYSLLSPCPACGSPLLDESPHYIPQVAATTPDLGQVIFEARSQLTADAQPESAQCIAFGEGCRFNLYESDHGTLRFVGLIPPVGQSECGGLGPACQTAPISIAGPGVTRNFYTLNTISDDGSKVFFTAPASPNGFAGDLYMRINHSKTVQLNASERTDCAEHDPCTGTPEPEAPQPATYALASADGSKVFFTDPEQLTDTPDGGDLYIYDTTLPLSDPNHVRHVYTDQQLDDGVSPSNGVLGTSSDGSYLYFLATGAILPGQPVLPGAAENGLYVWHNGAVSFIGSVDDFSVGQEGLPNDYRSKLGARVTPDGRTLLFTAFSGVGLTGYDDGDTCNTVAASGNGPCPELYLYKADSGTLRCVSCNPSGAPATTPASFRVRTSVGASRTTAYLNRALTSDGEHVFFETGERLLPGEDENGNKTDVYEYDASDGSLHLISSGKSIEDSHFLDASPDGHDVFFSTDQSLLGWDTDNSYDLYDARIGGGLPEPPLSAPACSGDACHGPVAPAPDTPLVQSTVISGSGNLIPPAAAPAKKPAIKSLPNAQKLRRALQICRRKLMRARKSCESQARRRFRLAASKKASKSRGGK